MSNLMEEIAEKNGMHLRPLIDLPPEAESTFDPNTFIPRKSLEYFSEVVKKELRPYILVAPPDVAGYESNGYFRRAVTWVMVMERRRQRQAARLRQIRSDYNATHRQPLYVWVFWCPGINDFIFKGWWTYLIGPKREYHGGGYKGNIEGSLFDEIMKMLPVENPHLYPLDDDEWMQLFAKQYQRGLWCGKPQGKAPIWAEVEGNCVKRILGRAEWPKSNQKKTDR